MRYDYSLDRPRPVLGVHLDDAFCENWLASLRSYAAELTFGEDTPNRGDRFYTKNPCFAGIDAVLLAAILRKYHPQNIIEVGSGFTTALMLDVNEKFLGGDVNFTCIDLDCQRLKTLMKAGDSVSIMEKEVQNVPLSVFDQLQNGDVLFVDGSHICGPDTDVNFIVFEVLPRLSPGVMIHFHDIFWPFEYPKNWVKNKWDFNEAYILRAFLSYNESFRILCSSSYAHLYHKATLCKTLGIDEQFEFNYDVIASLWLETI